MSDLQLERSVLEAKERDELLAIAQALGSKPGPRTKKADLVSQILQVTGVEAAAAPADKPRRTRARKAVAQDGPAEQLELAEPPTEAASPASTNGKARANGSQALEAQEHERSRGDRAAPAGGTSAEGRLNGPSGPGAPGLNGDQASTAPSASPASAGEEGEGPQAFQRSDGARQRADQRTDRADRGDLDPGLGNSRRRRRRNREKGPRGSEGRGEREFTAQAAEAPYSGELVTCAGLLDLREEGYGFLRTNGYLASSADVYVSITQVRRYGLRKGDVVEGAFRPAANNEKYPALVRVDSVSGLVPDDARSRPKFENLTPLFPDEKLALEVPGDPANVTARIVDLVSPIGKGQRGLIVSPPKAGKTTILKQIAHSIEANNPEVHLMILLVDERPEEVTDWRRSVKGEVIASTFDRPSDEHTQVAELAIERAKRLLEVGRDVVIVLDGITRLARAYNLAQPATGRIMSGGIDTGALYPPKKFFGSARNIEEGGSLTILATALVETGSRMDEVIFEEFKGTGNMELRLDRKLAERRIYPALDVNASSTRHEELLFDRQQLQQVWKLRRVLNALATDGNAAAGLELLVDKIRTTRSNDQFLAEIAKTPAPAI
ncbi:MAG TPA: transcription termination factor Rho [Acidimicrobiales bacterium]|nr:transcription termination factor Rho [Acidimicrobiales bacterium]